MSCVSDKRLFISFKFGVNPVDLFFHAVILILLLRLVVLCATA